MSSKRTRTAPGGAAKWRRGSSSRPARGRDARGRTHLVVLQDAEGRPRQLGLSAPLFREPWQDEVALGAASTAHGLLAQRRTLAAAAELGRRAMAGASTLIDGVLDVAKDQGLACREGCAHCCHQAVGVSAPEVFAIYELMLVTPSTERERQEARVRAADDRTRGLSLAARLSPELPCPLLHEGRCSVYEARPLACRGKNSLDVEACERTLHDPSTREQFLTGAVAVPCVIQPMRAFHAVSAGLQLALHDLYQLQVAPLELTAALRLMLDDPEGVSTAWLSGQDPFVAARGADISDAPWAGMLSGKR